MSMMENTRVILSSLANLSTQLIPYSIGDTQAKASGSFAFLIHPRSLREVEIKFPFAKYLPRKVLRAFARRMWPVVASKITVNLKNEDMEKKVSGYLIAHTQWPEIMLKCPESAKQKIHQAGILARNLGVSIIGLGALNSSITKAGVHLNVPEIGVTSGHSLTVAIAVEDIKSLIQERGLLPSCKIAIVGATGNIGKAISTLLANNYPNLILIDRSIERLTALKQGLCKKDNNTGLTLSTDISSSKDADIIVMATSSASMVLETEGLKAGTVIYDITEPTNVHCRDKNFVTHIKGCLVHVPGLKVPFKGWPLSEEVAFSCLAESILLSAEGWKGNFSVGETDIEKIQYIQNLFKKYNFKSALRVRHIHCA